MQNPNFLILDEPTNDLDLLTLTTLEEFLGEYKGCLVIVSHDRYFLDRLCDHLFVFEGEGVVKDYNGSYTQYRIEKEAEEEQKLKAEKAQKVAAQAAQVAQAPKTVPVNVPQTRKPTYKEKMEWESLEGDMAALETKKSQLTEKLSSGEGDHTQIAQWAQEVEEIVAQLEAKELRWLELSELF